MSVKGFLRKERVRFRSLTNRSPDCADGSCPGTPAGFSVCTIVRFVSIALLLLLAWAARGEVVTDLSADSARIGDVVQWRLTVPGANEADIVWPPVTEQFGDFYVLGTDTLSEKKSGRFGGPTVVYSLAAYDTGMVSTGDLELSGPSGLETVKADSLRIVSVLEASTDTTMAPLKPQESLPVTFMDVLRWSWPYILGAALLALLYWWWTEWKKRRRKRESGEDDEPAIPPYEEAIAALDALQRDNPYDRGDVKGYVGALTEVVKRLLERAHHDPVLEMTTYEVDLWLDKGRAVIQRDDLLDLLRRADAIKFAKMTLGPSDADDLFVQTKSLVEAYRDVPAARGVEEEPEATDVEASTEIAGDEEKQERMPKAQRSDTAAMDTRVEVQTAEVDGGQTNATAHNRVDDRSYLPPTEPGMPSVKPGVSSTSAGRDARPARDEEAGSTQEKEERGSEEGGDTETGETREERR
ncbi:hypothetical protein GF324_11220 [bacterium]|nr:hypothetical protein [bacterium]